MLIHDTSIEMSTSYRDYNVLHISIILLQVVQKGFDEVIKGSLTKSQPILVHFCVDEPCYNHLPSNKMFFVLFDEI